MAAIVPVVEGVAEVESIPVLLRRILSDAGFPTVSIARPFRVKRNQVIRPGQLERALKQASRARSDAAALLVLLDSDDDCPAGLVRDLSSRCARAVSLPASVVLAVREIESWFLGAKESLRGVRGIRNDAAPPRHPESIRGAKEELDRNMPDRRYLGVDDQPAFAQRMDIQLGRRRCRSLDKLVREAERLAAIVGRR